LEIVNFDEAAAHVYGEIRATLEKTGTPIGAMDMLIWSSRFDWTVIPVLSGQGFRF
jgi:hypothetical protein